MNKAKYLIISTLVVVAGAVGFFWTKNRLTKPADNTNNSAAISPTPETAPNYPTTIGNFLITDKEICEEDGKPIVYFFGSSSCSHCVWEKPIAKKVFDQFKDEISYHENFDSANDSDVFNKYSDINPGYVPFLVIGCKYARVGAGEQLGATDEESQKLEEEAMTAIVCKLTDGKPKDVCDKVKDQTKEIK